MPGMRTALRRRVVAQMAWRELRKGRRLRRRRGFRPVAKALRQLPLVPVDDRKATTGGALRSLWALRAEVFTAQEDSGDYAGLGVNASSTSSESCTRRTLRTTSRAVALKASGAREGEVANSSACADKVPIPGVAAARLELLADSPAWADGASNASTAETATVTDEPYPTR